MVFKNISDRFLYSTHNELTLGRYGAVNTPMSNEHVLAHITAFCTCVTLMQA